jgi:GAF domain-containing protein
MDELDDPARLATFERLDLLEAKPDAGFDRYTSLAAELLNAPVALVSLVDSRQQAFLSRLSSDPKLEGVDATPLSYSFCQHAVRSKEPLVIADARRDPLVSENPSITEFGLIAYAGAPIMTRDDQALGTLCVLDHEPRQWTPEQVKTLTDLAAAVASEIELRARMRR